MNNEEEKKQIQNQLSQLIQQDLVKIATEYRDTNTLNIDSIVTFVQDINLLNTYDVKYIHNNELNEIIQILSEESQNSYVTSSNAILVCFDYLLGKESNFKQAMVVNLFLKVDRKVFIDVYSVLGVLAPSVKDLYSYFIEYLYNDNFLTLDKFFQIEILYKSWVFCQQLFHDNEASHYAYKELKKLFYLAIEQDKEEVVFWLYYTPLHYYNSATANDYEEANKKFKIQIENPLEKYIQDKIIPRHRIEPNIRKIDRTKKIKVAFVMQRVVVHSTLKVFYTLLKSLKEHSNNQYEFILYDLNFPENGGSNQLYVNEFRKLGIKYVDLHTRIFVDVNPVYSLVEKSIKTREVLIEDQIDIMIGLHTRVEYMFLYKTRTAPRQIYWYHGSNAVYDVEGIDQRIFHSEIDSKAFKFDTFSLPVDLEHYDPKIDSNQIIKVRKLYPEDSLILGSIGRLVKLDNWDYLKSVAKIMNDNPNTIYLACGTGDQETIVLKLKELGIEDRFYFTGHIDAHLYGHIIDIWLDTFPSPQGQSKAEFYNKERNVFVMLMQNETKEQRVERISKFLEENRAYFEEACEFHGITFEKYNYLAFDVSELTQAFNSTEEYVLKANALIKSYDDQKLIADLRMLKKVYNYASDLISNQSFEEIL